MENKLKKSGVFLGINTGCDPSVAAVKNGKLIAYSEEERHVRQKHAMNLYPDHALDYCLKTAGVTLSEVEAVGINWDLEAYTDGRMKVFYETLRKKYPVDDQTLGWQNANLKKRQRDIYRQNHEYEWRRLYGPIAFPKIHTMPHHFVHAFQAYHHSPFDQAVCITMDGSGDSHCTVIWKCEKETITPIREFTMPHSLGWYYAAFTEYLGFEAYDGEYKVMGLAAYGKMDHELWEKVCQVLKIFPGKGHYEIEPKYLHYGPHNFSKRFTDYLAELFEKSPRQKKEKITDWHENLAFCVQKRLEECVLNLVSWAVQETGIRNICVGGGVGLNIKMNGSIFQMPEVENLYADPLCGDCGAAAGAALAACYQIAGILPEKLKSLALGYAQGEEDIEKTLSLAQISYERVDNVCEVVAEELANGKIVGWFQGRMEAGPRALGQRSILADPRDIKNRDRVNGIIKFREYWRPFCPSIAAEAMDDYFEKYVEALFMNLAFPCNEKLKAEAPAIVHVDGTVRVQMVRKETHPLFYELLMAFKRRTGVPVVMNTSFNLRGEPVVCTASDALRTFWSSGLDVLALGNFVVRKNSVQTLEASETSFSVCESNEPNSKDFSLENYGEIIREFIRKGYKITDYQSFVPNQSHLILRHDVDMEPDCALRMAELEAGLKVSSTYFVLPRIDLYNVFSPRVRGILREIIRMGHTIGLHFDASLYGEEDLEKACEWECSILEKVIEKKVEVVSFHRPPKNMLSYETPIAGLIHAYQPRFFKEAGYCSDSQGGWFYGHPLKHPAFLEKKGMQLLTHPVWWDSSLGEGALQRLSRLAREKAQKIKDCIADNCKPYRKHLDENTKQKVKV